MSIDFAEAYRLIKNLENSGQFTFPEPQETIEIGTIDPAAGTFTWSVPTIIQKVTVPPSPGVTKPDFFNLTVGWVSTKAVDLRVRFAVVPQPHHPVATPHVTHPAASSSSVAVMAATVTDPAGIGGIFGGYTNGGVTIGGYPTVSSTADEITIDIGLDCSNTIQSELISPPISRLEATVSIPGHDAITIFLFVIRPPVVGIGAFNVPAFPMAIVYAPPQTKERKNFASYSETDTHTRIVTTSISQETTTKTAQAYSATELIGKVAGAITAVVALVGSGGAGAAGGATVAGALAELGEALVGKVKDDTESVASVTNGISQELSIAKGILSSLDSVTSSNASVTANEDDHSITCTLSTSAMHQSAQGLGPGEGDRIVYLTNMKVVWMAVNGEVGIVVLGFDGPGSNAMRDLREEKQRLEQGQAGSLEFDLPTIEMLLAQDPMSTPPNPVAVVVNHPAVIAPPRYIPAQPDKKVSGTSTGQGGDVYVVSFDHTTEDKHITTSSDVHVEDTKPGWLGALFGIEDNTETTTTTTLKITHSIDTKDEVKLTSSVTFYSEDLDDRYVALNFYDVTFGTYAYVSPDSPFVRGAPTVAEP